MSHIFENDFVIRDLNLSFKKSLHDAHAEIEKIKELEKDEDLLRRLFHIEANIDSVINSLKKINQMITLNSYAQNRWKKIELSNPVKTSVEKFTAKASHKEIKLEYKNETKKAISYGDELILEEFVFDNLISNAIKFAPHQSVISVSLTNDKDYNIFTITDQGVGIEPEQLQHLYSVKDRFFTPDEDGKIGSGMSFPIILQIMKKLNGHLDIKSNRLTTEKEARGTTVKLYFHRF